MIKKILIVCLVCIQPLFAEFLTSSDESQSLRLWIDLYTGEETSFNAVMSDLVQAQVIYLGEVHTLKSHHRLHEDIIRSLIDEKKQVVLIMEQLEAGDQKYLDEFNAGKRDFTSFAQKIEWHMKWSNYHDYQNIMEAVIKGNGRIVAANAPGPLVKKVARSGIGSLTPEERKDLPEHIEPVPGEYTKLMSLIMGVHAFMKPEQTSSMVEAQSYRDGFIASAVTRAMKQEKSHRGDTVFVLLTGVMHVKYGLGVPYRVRLSKGTIRDRIVIASSSELKLSRTQKAMSRDISITHEDLRFINRPVADYLYFIQKNEEESANEKDKDNLHPGPGDRQP